MSTKMSEQERQSIKRYMLSLQRKDTHDLRGLAEKQGCEVTEATSRARLIALLMMNHFGIDKIEAFVGN